MPRKGPKYPTDQDWKDRVRDAIENKLQITHTAFAKRAKMSKPALSEALSPNSLGTTYVPEIHRALGWEIPPLVLTPDALELITIYKALPEREQGALIERARIEREKTKPRG